MYGLIFRPKNILQALTKLVGVAGGYPNATQNGFYSALTVDEFGNLWVRQNTQPGNILSNQNAPAANTTASITLAPVSASASVWVTSITASLTAVAAIAAPIAVRIRNGATILWQVNLGPLPAGGFATITTNPNIVGPAGATLTIDFAAAPGATNFETVAASGASIGP